MHSRAFNVQEDVPEVLRPSPRPASVPEPALMAQPPRPPSTNPWDPRVAPPSDDGRLDYSPIERRPTVYRPESPVDPAISPLSPEREKKPSRRAVTSLSGGDDYDSDDRRQSSSSAYSSNSVPYSSRTRASNLTTPIPEEELVERAARPLPQLPPPRYSPKPPYSQRSSGMSHRMSGDSAASSGDVAGHHQLLVVSNGPTSSTPPPVPPIPRSFVRLSYESHPPVSPQGYPEVEVPPPMIPTTEIDTGLIPVEDTASSTRTETHGHTKDCNITSASSFYYHKGFCEGAKEVIRGDIGIKKTQKPVRRTLTKIVARCTGCLYELDFSQIEIDVNKEGESVPSHSARPAIGLTRLSDRWRQLRQEQCRISSPVSAKKSPTRKASRRCPVRLRLLYSSGIYSGPERCYRLLHNKSAIQPLGPASAALA